MDENTAQKLLVENVLNVDSVDTVDADLVNRYVKQDAFAAIRGIFSAEDMKRVYTDILSAFDASRDHPSMGEPPGAAMSNFQKISIGGASNNWDYRPRFMRVLYNPLWEPDIYGMHDIFRKLATLRNKLQNYRPDFAIDHIEDGLWTAARIQHYPVGGGNICRHRDAVIATVTGDAGVTEFIQLVLLITSKGEHFEEGGAFLDVDGVIINLEENFKAGDVIVYDGRTMHGVHDIDPRKVPSLTSLEGRLVAAVSLYKDMSADKKLYAGYEDTFVNADLPPPESD